jgi:hypothetical protein
VLAVLVAIGGVIGYAHGALPEAASERSVKAAYIYRFLPYVEWPESVLPRGAPIVIGVMGADDIAAELEQLARKRPLQDRSVMVRRLGRTDTLTDLHVLFAGNDAATRLYQVTKAFEDRAVLTISDAEGAVDGGLVIGFVQADARVRFEVNTDAAERSRLKLSSRLLTVAARVRGASR